VAALVGEFPFFFFDIPPLVLLSTLPSCALPDNG
jgi:hypothetical protein